MITCPHCGHPAMKRTCTSWNTIGAVLWSDGKKTAPFKPYFPDFVFCKKCDGLFRLNEAKEICEEKNFRDFYPGHAEPELIESPAFEQMKRVVDIYEDKRSARIWMMFCFNDLARDGREHEITPEMQLIHEENLLELTELLDEGNMNDLIMKAEAFRNLGMFKESLILLGKIDKEELFQFRDKFIAEIAKRNRKVFKLAGS